MSLQRLCVEVIANNIDRFCLLYESARDQKLKDSFEFLQRDFGAELTKKVKHITDAHLDLLLHRHTTDVDLSLFQECGHVKVINRLFEIRRGLRKLVVHQTYRDPVELESIVRSLPYLESLDLQRTGCNDRVLREISRSCRELQYLDITFCFNLNFTEKGIKELYLRTLKSLNMFLVRLEDETVESVLRMPSLEKLNHEELIDLLIEIYDTRNGKVTPFKLRELKFISTDSTVETLRKFVHLCPRLEDIYIEFNSDADLQICCEFPLLKRITLSGLYSPHPCISNFLQASGPKLSKLHLISTFVNMKVLSSSCPNLRELILNKVRFERWDGCLPKLYKLEHLTFKRVKKTETKTSLAFCVMKVIRATCKLRRLDFQECGMIDLVIFSALYYIRSELSELNLIESDFGLFLMQCLLRVPTPYTKLKRLSFHKDGIPESYSNALLGLSRVHGDILKFW